MLHKINHQPIQQLNNGQSLELAIHTFEFSQTGPKIYLQANLHGSEIFGTFLLGRIIQKLQTLSEQEIENNQISGTLVIVPTVNPIAAQNTVYNNMTGRWNPTSGVNWNRIFDTRSFGSQKEMCEFYQKQLLEPNLAIEESLAANLMLLSIGSDYVIDIHTTGRESVNHIFSHPEHIKYFAELMPEINIETMNIPPSPSFENANVWPLLQTQDKVPKTCTWEASCHSIIDFAEIQTQEKKLWRWLKKTWTKSFDLDYQPAIQIKDIDCDHFVASCGGYFSWFSNTGDTVKKGTQYGIYYQPHSNNFVPAIAPFDFVLIGKYGIGAVSQGEQIAFIGRI